MQLLKFYVFEIVLSIFLTISKVWKIWLSFIAINISPLWCVLSTWGQFSIVFVRNDGSTNAFFKRSNFQVQKEQVGHNMPLGIVADSTWNKVITLMVTCHVSHDAIKLRFKKGIDEASCSAGGDAIKFCYPPLGEKYWKLSNLCKSLNFF